MGPSVLALRSQLRDAPWKTSYYICLSLCLVSSYLFVSGEKTLSASTKTSLCSYTLVVNEFDVSKCPTIGDRAQADGFHIQSQKVEGLSKSSAEKTDLHNSNAQANIDADKDLNSLSDKTLNSRTDILTIKSSSNRNDRFSGNENPELAGLSSLLRDMESKLLDEMVRSRELNSTLSRHEQLLSSAQTALEAYKANFSSVFRTMMLMEKKLLHQRRINKSLNQKLSNVILDVVEVNNVLTHKLPTGDASKSSKKFAVESSSALRSCPGITDKTKHFKDCLEVYDAGHHRSDVYYIKPLYSGCPIPVWCDMDSPKAGWLVFQRRRDGSVDFNQDWDKYRSGFGDISGEHWLGNDNLFLLTNQGRYQLRIDLWDFSGNRVHALYSTFKIEGERDEYKLHIAGYSGSAQDSLHRHNGRKFSAKDRDNDARREANCAQEWEAGWWFDNCWFALLNGPYQNRSDVSWRGLAWNHWKREQLRGAEMKMRPLLEQSEEND